MIREIQARTLLSHHRDPDPWFGIRYGFNIYRGCQHQCIYCDSRSECYGIEDFNDVLVKVNAVERLRDELPRKRVVGTVGTGSMSDPYTPVELQYNLTGRALEVLAEHRFPLHLITKSDLILRDIDTLAQIAHDTRAAVSFTLTTADDDLAAIVEPGAPRPSARLRAMEALAARGVTTGVTLMPVLPFIEDTVENVTAIVRAARDHGATYVLAGLAVTLRNRQRDYYYARLDEHFPGLRARYERRYGERYACPPPNAHVLEQTVSALCADLGLATRLAPWQPPAATQAAPPASGQLRLL